MRRHHGPARVAAPVPVGSWRPALPGPARLSPVTTFETLKPPSPLADGAMRVTPLGGLGEVGRNMTVFEVDGKLLIVDCGVLFPEEDQPGVDLILPDFSYIEDRLDDVVALVLTHGHEDTSEACPTCCDCATTSR